MNEVEFYLEDLKSKFSKINPSEYYLAYSGGRDSHFLLWFIREYLHEPRIPAVFSNTGMEIPEIRERALANAQVILKPAMKHAEIKEKYGIPLNTKNSDEWVYMYQKKRLPMKTLDEQSKQEATKHLDCFTKIYCRDKTVTDDLVFRCNECDFLGVDGQTCLAKVMKMKLCSNYKDFGCMGDL